MVKCIKTPYLALAKLKHHEQISFYSISFHITKTHRSLKIYGFWIFTKLAPRPTQFVSCDIRLCDMDVLASPVGNRNKESWRLLVKERIAKILIIEIPFCF